MIQHDLIGTHPQLQHFDLAEAIAQYPSLKYKTDQHFMGYNISHAAEHFYGLQLRDCGSIPELIDAINSLEQSLMVH